MKSFIKFALVSASLLVIPASQASKLPVTPQAAAAKDELEKRLKEARARNVAAAAAIEKASQENQELRELEERLKKQNAELQEQQRVLRQRSSLAAEQHPSSYTNWLIDQQAKRKIEPKQLNRKQGQQPQVTLNQSASTSYFTRFKNFWSRLFARTQ